jgi:hypothetical protein
MKNPMILPHGSIGLLQNTKKTFVNQHQNLCYKFGDMFQNIGLGSKLFFANNMILHEKLVEHFVCFVQNI